jgi:hypothetical protein
MRVPAAEHFRPWRYVTAAQGQLGGFLLPARLLDVGTGAPFASRARVASCADKLF